MNVKFSPSVSTVLPAAHSRLLDHTCLTDEDHKQEGAVRQLVQRGLGSQGIIPTCQGIIHVQHVVCAGGGGERKGVDARMHGTGGNVGC